MDVLPLVLSEDEVLLLPDAVLIKVSEIATDKIVAMLFSYLKDSTNEEVKAKINRTFRKPLTIRRDSKSAPIAMMVKSLGDITYKDIYYGLPRESLESLRGNIESILDNQYAVAWIEPITSKQYKKYIDDLYDMGAAESNKVIANCISSVARRIENMGYAFKDPPQAKPRPTEVTKVLRRAADYRLIVRGINFLLKQMHEGRNPDTWRIL